MTDWPPEIRAVVAQTERLADYLAKQPEWLARLDQDAASVRDRLDDLGVTITHGDALLAGLAFMQLMVERVPPMCSLPPIAQSIRAGIIAALLDHLPVEARP